MKKNILKLILGVTFATVLWACSKPSNEGKAPTSQYEQFETEWGDSANNGFFD